MSLDPEPNVSLLEAYTALVSFLHGNDDVRAILQGIPPETSSWPSSDDIFTPLLLHTANILHCRPRNVLHNRAIIRKLFIKVHPDKLTPGISINGKHGAHCIYSFLARLKDPRHNLNLPRLYPCIITGFSTNNMQLPTRFEFDTLVLSSQIPSVSTSPAGKVSSWCYCRTAFLSRRLGTIPRKREIYVRQRRTSHPHLIDPSPL